MAEIAIVKQSVEKAHIWLNELANGQGLESQQDPGEVSRICGLDDLKVIVS